MDICHKQELYLLHGSRGGLKGEIRPCSRENCDFGRGFYMGTNPNQVKGLVVSDRNPVFYELKIEKNTDYPSIVFDRKRLAVDSVGL